MNEQSPKIDYAAFRRRVAEMENKQVFTQSVERLNTERAETVAFLREQSYQRFLEANRKN